MNFFKRTPAETTTSGIAISLEPEDRPEFERIYTSTLTNQVKVEIKLYTSSVTGSRYSRGELTQKDGRWVIFDPERVAEKILDPVLVPLVERVCAEVFALDKAFLSPPPASFVDETGQKWIRA